MCQVGENYRNNLRMMSYGFMLLLFRLYVWILLKAAYEDGLVLNGMTLKKGQYVRAYSQLSEDLMYIEGRGKNGLPRLR